MAMTIEQAFAPKSDQQNAENFISGPKTIKITEVRVTGGEQPVSIFFEGDDGRPWKPCKTAGRCLMAIWGKDETKWVGLSCTIYNDPKATWAGLAVGGIRVSHMEGLTEPRSLMLSKAKGKREATIIKPLILGKVAESRPVDRDQLRAQMEAVASDAQAKGKWWRGLTEEEQAVVREMAAEKGDAE